MRISKVMSASSSFLHAIGNLLRFPLYQGRHQTSYMKYFHPIHDILRSTLLMICLKFADQSF